MSLPEITFLAPTAGIVAASVSVPILVLFYFLKLRRRPLRVSSTLLWESAVRDLQVNTPFRWIRFSWLLLLQLLLLALLILALARPALDLPAPSAGRVIILVDCSASMAARDVAPDAVRGAGDRITRLEEAKRKALDLVDRLSTGPAGEPAEAMVIAFADRPRTVINFTRDRGALRNAIQAIEQTDQPDRLGAALKVVEAFVARPGGDDSAAAAPAPRIVLISDGGMASASPEEAGDSGPPAALGDAPVEFLRAGPAPLSPVRNLGIVALSAKRDYDDPAVVRVFARVQSTLPEEAHVSLALGFRGNVIETKPLVVPGAGDHPGEVSHTFELNTAEGGPATVALLGTGAAGDALASDNICATVLQAPRSLRLLLVSRAGEPSDADYALIDALETLGPRELRRVNAAEYERRAGELLAQCDLVVFDRVRPSSLPTAPSISFGATLPIPGLSVLPRETADGSSTTEFVYWQRAHPVMRYVSLAGVLVTNPMILSLPEETSARPPPGAADGPLHATVLASGADGPLIALAEQGVIRRIIVAFELAATNWWRNPSFPIFLANAVDYLALQADQNAGVAYTTIQSISVRTKPGATSVVAEAPGVPTKIAEAGPDGRATLGVLDRAGLYSVTGAAETDTWVAVNLLSPRESGIAVSDTVPIGGRSAHAGTGGLIAPREIWGWLVMAALALLAVEWFVFARSIRM